MQSEHFPFPLVVSCLHLICMAAHLSSDQERCFALQGHIIGADEFLELCKHWKRMTDKFHMGWKALKPKALQTVRYMSEGAPHKVGGTFWDCMPPFHVVSASFLVSQGEIQLLWVDGDPPLTPAGIIVQ